MTYLWDTTVADYILVAHVRYLQEMRIRKIIVMNVYLINDW